VRKTTIRFLGIALTLFVVVVFNTLAFSGKASAQTSAETAHLTGAKAENTLAHCQTLEVHLYGVLPAATTCLDGNTTTTSPKTAGLITPDTSTSSCVTKALWIWENANESGAEICFIGSGFANMTDYRHCGIILCYSWNDAASSFYTGCSQVTFHVDIGATNNDKHATASAYQASNFPFGAVGNDQLSSIAIAFNC